jgi:hypothetical protein
MKAIPALRQSYANGLLTSLAVRGPSTIEQLVASVPSNELFKGNTTHPDQRARDLLQYGRDLGLVESN